MVFEVKYFRWAIGGAVSMMTLWADGCIVMEESWGLQLPTSYAATPWCCGMTTQHPESWGTAVTAGQVLQHKACTVLSERAHSHMSVV